MIPVLTALDAGCIQQPKTGELIGLNGSLFTTNQVQITSPHSNTTSKRQGLSDGIIIGIAIAGLVFLFILLGIVFVYTRKRRNANRLKDLNSPLDSRFGAANITAPNRGAFSSPQHSPPLFKKVSVPMKRVPRPLNFSRPTRGKSRIDDLRRAGEATPLTAKSPPEYSPTLSPPDSGRSSILPTHAAYIPHEHSPPARDYFVPATQPPTYSVHPESTSSLSPPFQAHVVSQVRNSGVSDNFPCPPQRARPPMVRNSSQVRNSASSGMSESLPPPSQRTAAPFRANDSSQWRKSAMSDPIPPPPLGRPHPLPISHLQRPMSTIPSASLMQSHAESLEARGTSEPVNHNTSSMPDADSGPVGRAQDSSASSTRRIRDGSVGRNRESSVGRKARDANLGRRTRDSSVGRTRDTSVGSLGRRARESIGSIATRVRDGSAERNTAAPISISGPMIQVGDRFESDTQAKKAMETLNTRGLDGTLAHDPHSKEMAEKPSPESARSVELWPGSY